MATSVFPTPEGPRRSSENTGCSPSALKSLKLRDRDSKERLNSIWPMSSLSRVVRTCMNSSSSRDTSVLFPLLSFWVPSSTSMSQSIMSSNMVLNWYAPSFTVLSSPMKRVPKGSWWTRSSNFDASWRSPDSKPMNDETSTTSFFSERSSEIWSLPCSSRSDINLKPSTPSWSIRALYWDLLYVTSLRMALPIKPRRTLPE